MRGTCIAEPHLSSAQPPSMHLMLGKQVKQVNCRQSYSLRYDSSSLSLTTWRTRKDSSADCARRLLGSCLFVFSNAQDSVFHTFSRHDSGTIANRYVFERSSSDRADPLLTASKLTCSSSPEFGSFLRHVARNDNHEASIIDYTSKCDDKK